MARPTEILTFDVLDLSDPKGSCRSNFSSQPFEIILEGIECNQVQLSADQLKSFLVSKGVSSKGPITSRHRNKEFVVKSHHSGHTNERIYRFVKIYRSVIRVRKITKKQALSLIQFSTSSSVNISIRFDSEVTS